MDWQYHANDYNRSLLQVSQMYCGTEPLCRSYYNDLLRNQQVVEGATLCRFSQFVISRMFHVWLTDCSGDNDTDS